MRSTGRVFVVCDRALAVDRLAERVDDAAEQRVADRHLGDAAGGADLVAFLDLVVVAEDHDADAVLFEVQREAHDAVRELAPARSTCTFERPWTRAMPSPASTTVPTLTAVDVGAELLDLLLDDAGDLFGPNRHGVPPCRGCRSPCV